MIDEGQKHTSTKRFRTSLILLLGALVGFVSALLLAYVVAQFRFAKIATYRGDGEFNRVGNIFLAPGYLIEFQAFDLAKPFKSSFQIANCPTLGTHINFGVDFVSANEEELRKLDGKLHLQLSHGEDKIFDINSPLSAWTSSQTPVRGGLERRSVFFFDSGKIHSSVAPDIVHPGDALVFTIEYDPQAGGIQGFGIPRLQVGGSI